MGSTGRAPLARGGQFTDLSFPLKMFNLLLVFLPALACIARDPNEGKEKVHSFEVKYNRAKRREKRQILPENFLPGPNSPGEMEAIPVEELPTADAVEDLPIVDGFPVAEGMQEEKVEQVAGIDVLPASDRMMPERLRRGGRKEFLWADDAMVAVRLPKVDLSGCCCCCFCCFCRCCCFVVAVVVLTVVFVL